MDKNIAALLREDACTVHIVFGNNAPINELDGETLEETVAQSLASSGQNDLRTRWTTARGLTKRGSAKAYTYVTNFKLVKGDQVVVEAGNDIKIATVHAVDDQVEIEPNSTTTYKWVISKIDMAAHEANMGRNAQIEMTVADAYRQNLRASFSAQILAGVPEDQKAVIMGLLK